MPVTTTLSVRAAYLAHHCHAVDLGYRYLQLIVRQLVYAAHCATLTVPIFALRDPRRPWTGVEVSRIKYHG